ncbi:MAG: DUF1552 domain-containing protein, partial [Lentisphaeraceae bacterium]|nr:DUF1552 domain-containing protein [Lentisphaeraceae bacterium]
MNINRRNFLYGSGVALALPWMESFASAKGTPKSTPKRFMAVHHPDGVGLPLKKDPAWKDWSWFPEAGKTETDFRLTKVLDVLKPLRNDICIYSGLSHPAARNIHGHSNADQFLTGADIGASGPYKNTISLDQAIAEHNGHLSRHSSLVMCTNGGSGAPRGTHTVSFNKGGRPNPGLNKPKQIFDMLFITRSRDARNRLTRRKS